MGADEGGAMQFQHEIQWVTEVAAKWFMELYEILLHSPTLDMKQQCDVVREGGSLLYHIPALQVQSLVVRYVIAKNTKNVERLLVIGIVLKSQLKGKQLLKQRYNDTFPSSRLLYTSYENSKNNRLQRSGHTSRQALEH